MLRGQDFARERGENDQEREREREMFMCSYRDPLDHPDISSMTLSLYDDGGHWDSKVL